MFNPQQNININILYNLNADKKVLPAKKINKHTKAQTQLDNNCDIEIKLNKKNVQNNQRKGNQPKFNHQNKKNKSKKHNSIQRNTLTPDLYNQRRLKTEGPSADNDFSSAFKKDSKTKGHAKSVIQPLHKISQSTKKSGLTKTSKSLRATHLASCNIPNIRKNQLDFAEHTISQAVSSGFKKRRAHSTFIRNDKIVAKLLNVSILASQLGGSQPITSERRQSQSSQIRNFKEYMSSMDMRIIHTMQNDVPVFADKKEHPEQDTIRRIMVSKNISLQELTRRVIVIQKFLREKVKEKVIHKYKLLFQQITKKMVRQEKISEISGIAHSPQEELQNSYNNGLSIFENQGLSSAFQSTNQRKNSIESNSIESEQLESSINNMRWIEENQSSKQGADNNIGLNLKKYRELVNEQMQKNISNEKGKQKQKYKEQTQQWKNINKQITNVMNDKGAIDFQLITDELIKQSKSNQYWIDNDLDSSGQRPPFGEEQWQEETVFGENNNRHKFSQKSQDIPDVPVLSYRQKHKNRQRSEDSLDQDQQDNLYDKNKYEESRPNKVTTEQQLWSHCAIKNKLKQEGKKVEVPSDKINIVSKSKNQQIWITQQISQDNVVKNYLDCGLDDFGINLNSRIIQIPTLNKDDFEQIQNEQNYSLDEAIGNKFEQANLAVIKKKAHDQADLEPAMQKAKPCNMQVDQLVENVVKFLITEFATDISTILKKVTGPQPQRRAPVQKTNGIATNFNAIRDYLKKFILFIKKQEKNLQKITETINKDIGPTSLQILTYLRPELEDSSMPFELENNDQSYEDEDGLFVIPADIFQAFEAELQREYFALNHKQMTQRMKAYLSFWHRCIFQSYNECLDYQRPFGIEGKPYEWSTQTKMFRGIKRQKVLSHLQRAQNRLLDLTMLVGGIIFEKNDSPFSGADLSEEQKHMMNQQRLSRILANELLQSEQSWINYNDQLAQLLVQLSRIIEEKIFFQYGTQLKKLQRRRKMIAQQSAIQETVVFNLQEL